MRSGGREAPPMTEATNHLVNHDVALHCSDRATNVERTAMVGLPAVYIQSPNNGVAIRAAEFVIAMLGFNADAERTHAIGLSACEAFLERHGKLANVVEPSRLVVEPTDGLTHGRHLERRKKCLEVPDPGVPPSGGLELRTCVANDIQTTRTKLDLRLRQRAPNGGLALHNPQLAEEELSPSSTSRSANSEF